MQRSTWFQTPPCYHNQEQATWSAQKAPLSQPDSKSTKWCTCIILYNCTLSLQQINTQQNEWWSCLNKTGGQNKRNGKSCIKVWISCLFNEGCKEKPPPHPAVNETRHVLKASSSSSGFKISPLSKWRTWLQRESQVLTVETVVWQKYHESRSPFLLFAELSTTSRGWPLSADGVCSVVYRKSFPTTDNHLLSH